MKRIVLIVSTFPQLSESFIVSKFTGLLEKGWDVHVVCGKHNINSWKDFPQAIDLRNRVHQTWSTNPKWLSSILFPFLVFRCLLCNFPGTVRYLTKGIRKHGGRILKRLYLDGEVIALKPDLVHFEFGAVAVGRADLNNLLNCKEIVSFRGYDLNYSGIDRPRYYQEIWHHSNAFHFLGENLLQKAIQRGFPSEKLHILVPPAIDTSFFTPTKKNIRNHIGTKMKPLRILSVGRLEWIKGYEFAFQAIRILIDSGMACNYQIVGTGSYLEPLSFVRYQLGLTDIITFLGGQSRDVIKEKLEWADVFLHAAVSEGFCNAVIESQAMQVPVVCTDAGGLPENVVDGVTGFVVPRRNPQALAEKLTLLTSDSNLRHKMGVAGREQVLTKFKIEDQIEKFERFYKELLDQNED